MSSFFCWLVPDVLGQKSQVSTYRLILFGLCDDENRVSCKHLRIKRFHMKIAWMNWSAVVAITGNWKIEVLSLYLIPARERSMAETDRSAPLDGVTIPFRVAPISHSTLPLPWIICLISGRSGSLDPPLLQRWLVLAHWGTFLDLWYLQSKTGLCSSMWPFSCD